MIESYSLGTLSLFILLLSVVILALRIGQLDISFSEIFKILWGKGHGFSQDIIVNLRLPRILFAALAGCALALCGYVMQSSLQNVLADPYIFRYIVWSRARCCIRDSYRLLCGCHSSGNGNIFLRIHRSRQCYCLGIYHHRFQNESEQYKTDPGGSYHKCPLHSNQPHAYLHGK